MFFDTIANPPGDDELNGGLGNDAIFGESGDDLITGGQGSDTLDGGSGNDTINIAEGDSVLGGDGDDLFVVTDTGEAGSSAITIDGGERNEDRRRHPGPERACRLFNANPDHRHPGRKGRHRRTA